MTLKALAASLLVVFFVSVGVIACPFAADASVRYEYKVLRLGSLSSLQKDDRASDVMSDVENILNDAGLEGWEMVNAFAVRTTFDPNVFFVIMKRPLPTQAEEGGELEE
jgi:hypothetical protein